MSDQQAEVAHELNSSLERLAGLHTAGHLTDEEFSLAKEHVLGTPSSGSPMRTRPSGHAAGSVIGPASDAAPRMIDSRLPTPTDGDIRPDIRPDSGDRGPDLATPDILQPTLARSFSRFATLAPRRALMVLGGVVIAVSAFLPWVTANAGLFSFSKNGMEGDGKLTLGGGVAIAVVTFLAASNEKRWPVARIFVGLSAICVVVVSVVDYFDVRRLAREAAADPARACI